MQHKFSHKVSISVRDDVWELLETGEGNAYRTIRRWLESNLDAIATKKKAIISIKKTKQ